MSGKCPNCGGQIKFNTSNKTGYCSHCDSEFLVEEAVTVNNINIDNSQTFNIKNQHVEHQTIIQQDEKSFEKRMHRLEVYLENGHFEDAIRESNEMQKLYPDSSKTYSLYIKAHTHNLSENLDSFKNSLGIPSAQPSKDNLGNLYSLDLAKNHPMMEFFYLAKKYAKTDEERRLVNEVDDYLCKWGGLRALKDKKQEATNKINGREKEIRAQEKQMVSKDTRTAQDKANSSAYLKKQRGDYISTFVIDLIFTIAAIAGEIALFVNKHRHQQVAFIALTVTVGVVLLVFLIFTLVYLSYMVKTNKQIKRNIVAVNSIQKGISTKKNKLQEELNNDIKAFKLEYDLYLSENHIMLVEPFDLENMSKENISAEEEAENQNKYFDLVLTELGNNKVGVMKVFQTLGGGTLMEVKKKIDNLPVVVKQRCPFGYAKAFKERFEEVGATIELISVD